MSPLRFRFAAGAVALVVAVAVSGCADKTPEGETLSGVSENGEVVAAPQISPPEPMVDKKTGVATPPEGLGEDGKPVVATPPNPGSTTKPSTPSNSGGTAPTTPNTQAPRPTPKPSTPAPPTVTTPPLSPDNNTSSWVEHKTLNGTASLRAPSNWGNPVIAGEWVASHNSDEAWANAIQWNPVPGKSWSFTYTDNPYTNPGVCLPKTDYQVIESVDANYMLQGGAATKLDGLSVARWAEKDSSSNDWIANIALVTSGGSNCQPSPGTVIGDKAVYVNASGSSLVFKDQQAAVNWLSGTEATLAMNAIETLKIYNVSASTAPTPAP